MNTYQSQWYHQSCGMCQVEYFLIPGDGLLQYSFSYNCSIYFWGVTIWELMFNDQFHTETPTVGAVVIHEWVKFKKWPVIICDKKS